MKLLALLTALLAAPPQDETPAPADEHVATGPRFVVTTRWRSERSLDGLARQVLEVVEATGDEAASALALGPPEAEGERLPVDLVESVADFRAAVDAADRGEVLAPNAVWVDRARNEVLLALRPRVHDRVLFVLDLPPHVLRRAAVEAAGQVRRSAGLHGAVGDAWLARGIDLLAAQRALQAVGRSSALQEEPVTSTALDALRVRLAEGEDPLAILTETDAGRADAFGALDAPDAARLVAAELVASGALALPPLDAEDGVAAAAPTPAEVLRAPRDVPGVLERLGDEGRAEWRGVLAARVAELEPAWIEREPSMATHERGHVQMARHRVDALCMSAAPAGTDRFAVRGRVVGYSLDRDGPAQVDVVVGDVRGDHFLVAFNSKEGTYIFHYSPVTGVYEPLKAGVATELPVGVEVPFEVRVEEDVIVVGLGRMALPPLRVTGRDLSGGWGLGCHAGTGALWIDVELVPLD